MIGVTVGLGPDKAAAEEACRRFSIYTGLPTKVLGEAEMVESGEPIPHMLKLHCFRFVDQDRVCYFDADLWFQRPWSPTSFAPGIFWAVRDIVYTQHIMQDAAAWNIPANNYFNSGLMIVDRSHTHVLDLASRLRKQMGVSLGTGFVDQSAINTAVHLSGTKLGFVDRRYNWVQSAGRWMHRGIPVIGAHKYKAGQSTADMFRSVEDQTLLYTDNGLSIQTEDFKQLAGMYQYERVGHDKRQMELLPDGNIGEGIDRLEQWWLPLRTTRGIEITIYGYEKDTRLHEEDETCRLVQETSDAFKGYWTKFEKMPVVLRRSDGVHMRHPSGVVADLLAVSTPISGTTYNIAELGVGEGLVSEGLLQGIRDAHLFMTDTWSSGACASRPYQGLGPSGRLWDKSAELYAQSRYVRALRRTMFAGARKTIVREDPDRAFYKFPKNYLDMIYTAAGALTTMQKWWDKLKTGGVLIGYKGGSGFSSGAHIRLAASVGAVCCTEREHIWYIRKG